MRDDAAQVNSPRGRRDQLPLCVLLVLAAALVFCQAADALHPLVGAVVLGLAALVLPRPLAWSSRPLIYAAVGSLVAAVMGDQILPIAPERFFLLPGHLVGPALVYAAGAMLLFETRPESLGMLVAALLGILTVTGNRMMVVSSDNSPSLLQFLLPDFWKLFPAVAVGELLAVLHLVRRMEPAVRRAGGADRGWRDWRRFALMGVSLFSVVVWAMVLYGGALFYERMISLRSDMFLNRFFSHGFSGFVFRKTVDLWQTPSFRQAMDTTVALRVRAAAPPGYLRGRAYTYYDHGHWLDYVEQKRTLSGTPGGGRLAFFTYVRPGLRQLRVRGKNMEENEVFLSSALRGEVLPMTGGGNLVSIAARELFEDANGTLAPEGWDRRASYRFLISGPEPAYPFPRTPGPEYLQIPESLGDGMAPLLDELDAFSPPGGKPTTPQRIARVCTFLDQRCRYNLDIAFASRDADPVLQFLNETRQGHCELFATAAVMLLRAQGVPARYVTGFVCEEQHPRGDYWLARLKDAHAWVEAWSVEEQRWVLVEATPPAGLPHADPAAWSEIESRFDSLRFLVERFLSWVRNGFFAEAVMRGLYAVWQGLLQLVATPLRALLVAVVVAAAGGAVLLRWRKRRGAAGQGGVEPERRRLRQAWHRLERGLARRGLRRPASLTVREHVAALAGRLPPERFRELQELAAEFERLRYAPAAPAAPAVEAFRGRVRRFSASL